MDQSSKPPQTVADIIHRDVPITPETMTFEGATLLLGESSIASILVVDGDRHLSGIFSSSDMARCLKAKTPKSAHLKDIMIKDPITVGLETSLRECAEKMNQVPCRFLPVVENQKVLGMVSIFDIQEVFNKNLSEKIEELESVQESLNSRNEILGMVCHDIRSPLNVILICTEYLLGEDSELNDEHKSFVQRIRHNCDRANALATDILDLAKVESGGGLEYSQFDTETFLAAVVGDLKFPASKKNIQLHIEKSENLLVSADKRRIQQVLENLVTNAIKFTPSGRNIYLSVSYLERGGQGFARFGVRDEGQGIKDKDVEQIFNKFSQLDTGAAKKLGVGLGLSLATQFVKAHRGEISVDGGYGKGATFFATIPGAMVAAKVKKPSADVIKILIVDDDSDIREYFAEELAEHGYQVYIADDGEDGVHKHRLYRPDLIISDIKMPKLDGFEFLAAVRSSPHNCPFILCSGVYPNLSEDIARSVFQADNMLEKPVLTQNLLDAVHRIFPPEDKK